ncbi:MAG: hypothetical protein AUG46_06290 [Acidobacteria bacterium 13_1_20CM_3_58_11]|nr:MAG: hypothetical protein AUG46_06290 [Acidobacteria bacterium 13_1_20CM_3_58_11]
MNWNNTQFDNFEPITLKAARKVGSIFKYMKPTDPFLVIKSHFTVVSKASIVFWHPRHPLQSNPVANRGRRGTS